MENFNALCTKLAEDTGVDPRIMYCQATGMPIGALMEDAATALAASVTLGDDEQMMDELLIRTLNSARPAPAWNMFERDTLERIRHSNPRLLLSYLLNRLYTPVVKTDQGNKYASVTHKQVHDRINQYIWSHEVVIPEVQLNRLLLVLLELDARWSLLTMGMPKNIQAMLEKATIQAYDEAIETLNDWLTKLVEKEIENNKRLAEQERSFVRGNKLVKTAYMQEFIRQTPRSPERIKVIQREAKKQDGLEFLAALEDELTHIPDNGKPVATMSKPRDSKPAYTPRTLYAGQVAGTIIAGGEKKPIRFGGMKS